MYILRGFQKVPDQYLHVSTISSLADTVPELQLDVLTLGCQGYCTER